MDITYQQRRGEIKTYFDRTAMAAWAALTSSAPVSGVRAKVRAGREAMRGTLLSWLPENMSGMRLLDAGCGTGALALVAAARGAEVVAIDLSPQLVALAAERAAGQPGAGRIDFRSGDMLDAALGKFDYIICMDSIIHYQPADAMSVIRALQARARRAVIFTFVPKTPMLMTMLTVGKIFPRKDRSPAVVPLSIGQVKRAVDVARTRKISASFYTSQAVEVVGA
jgi:magnesium-protoporphyrin O-methyltransferase